MGVKVPSDAGILWWLLYFSASLMNWCDIGSDGEAPFHRLRGRRDNTPIWEFGEKMLFMLA